MTTAGDFIDRAKKAKRARELETNTDLRFAEIGIEIGKVLRSDPIQAGTVRRWFRDVVPSDLDTIWGMAQVLNVDAGWLAFGERCQAQPPRWFTPHQPPAAGTGADHHSAARHARSQLTAIKKAGHGHRPKRTG